jgi:shikimate dehydrogenase
MKFGLIGKTLTHSYSPDYFKKKFERLGLKDYQYKAYELAHLDANSLNELVIAEQLKGFNITIPYKESIVPLLNELSEDALNIGAVNTVKVNWINQSTFSLKGYNTDWTGFLKSIRPFLTIHHQKALILGTGGASKAIAYALKSMGIDYYFVSRTATNKHSNSFSYNELNEFIIKQFKFIINTTPIGTFPNVFEIPEIPFQYIGCEHLLVDLVYNPNETKFMKMGKEHDATVLNGLGMLQFQADAAWEIWRK